jgi:Cd2+/Zn2+-exporting ATPase
MRAMRTVPERSMVAHARRRPSGADQLRTPSRQVIADLHDLGVQRVMMLTGDHEHVARAIGSAAGVDDVRAQLLPHDKSAAVAELAKHAGPVAMVGDGINDAPALAVADVGIAMGASGTTVALETADVALMADELDKLPAAIRLARRAMRVVHQNVALSPSPSSSPPRSPASSPSPKACSSRRAPPC